MQSQHCPNHAPQPLQPVAEVFIPTATAIVHDHRDPLRILVGVSKKHALPVLPGGKIDLQDITSTEMRACAENCIRRELREEIGVTAQALTYFETNADPERDKRVVTAKSLRGTLVDSTVSTLPDEALVLGHYGVPDHVFSASIDPLSVSISDELSGLRWIDCRNGLPEALAAGHGAVVQRYLDSLNRVVP